MPQISVIMPAFNSGLFIGEAIESILSQSFIDFEFIIINDGSTDNTEDVILSYKDSRIQYHKHDATLGNNITRSEGLHMAKGKYLAIMDSDDISMPRRLEIQFNYLEKHWETEILGGAIEWFGDAHPKKEYAPLENDYIKASLLFKNCIFQPTVMLRRESLDRPLIWLAEWENMGDYELWVRAAGKGLHIENLKDILVKYRKTSSQISIRNIEDRLQKLKKFLSIRLENLDIHLQENESDLLFNFIRTRISLDENKFALLTGILGRIEVAVNKRRAFTVSGFKAAILFYRLRLAKYYYLEYKKNYPLFLSHALSLLFKAGLKSSLLFYRNETFFHR